MKYLKTYEAYQPTPLEQEYLDNLKRNRDFKFSKGCLELHQAIRKRDKNLVMDIIEKGEVDLNCVDAHGYTPLMVAADQGDMILILKLLKAGADWSIKNNYGKYFFDYLNFMQRDTIIEKYPEIYQDYKMKKDAEKYGI